MRVSPITNYQRTYTCKNSQTTFKKKYPCTKFLSGIFGTMGTVGAIGGTIIMTGGIALPAVLAYGGMCALSGAGLGYAMDRGNNDDDANEIDLNLDKQLK